MTWSPKPTSSLGADLRTYRVNPCHGCTASCGAFSSIITEPTVGDVCSWRVCVVALPRHRGSPKRPTQIAEFFTRYTGFHHATERF